MWWADMAFDLDIWHTDLNIKRDHLLIKNDIPTKCEGSGEEFLSYQLHKMWETDMTFDLLTSEYQ